jgi:kinesin family member C1
LQTEAVKQKNDLLKEVDSLRSELHLVWGDRDNKSAQVDSLMNDLGTYKEMTGKSAVELENAKTKSAALVVLSSAQVF